MRFAQPQFLYLALLVLPLLSAFFFWAWRVRQKLMAQFIHSRLLSNLTVGVSHKRQKFRLVLFVVATGFLFLALARPQWGFDWEEAKQQGLDIVVAIDTSRSMLAEDIAPNRLTRAKLAALDLMRLAKNDRLGLVAFAGSSFLQSPLTLDEEAFRQSVEALDVGIIPQGGSSLSDAMETALTAFETNNDNHKVLVLFTDGEDHDEDNAALTMAEKVAKDGMRIFTIGVGTAEGEMLRAKDEQGNISFIKDDSGNAVKSHLNETLLQKIGTAANGFYLPLRGANPMETLYARGLAPLPKSESTTKLTKVFRERFHWPLTLAILCLIGEMFLPERIRVGRKATEKTSTTGNPELKKAVVASLVLFLVPLMAMSSPSSAKRQFEKGKFDTALEEYERLSEQKTNDYRLHYNAGTSAYQAKQFDTAEKHLNAALNSPEISSDLETQQRTYYNLGNTLFQLGAPLPEPDKKQETWEQAIASYDRALKLNPSDPDAKNNLEFVKKKLEELKQQQPQQQKNDKDDKKKDQDKKDQQQDQKDQKDQNKDKKDDQKDSKEQNDGKQDQKDQKNQKDQKDQKQGEKSEQQKKDEEQKKQQQQQQAKKDKEKKEKEAQQKQAQDKGEKPDQKQDEEMQAVAAGQMTPQQAKQFLDAQRQDEKALIFSPENKPQKQQNKKLKDW